jgi:hypothetical protein
MVLGNVGAGSLFALGLAVGAVSIALLAGVGYALKGDRRCLGFLTGHKGHAESLLSEFSSKISLIEHKQRVLSVYTTEYVATFLDAGWEDLQALVDNLRTIETSLRLMFDRRQFVEVTRVCEVLLGRSSVEAARLVIAEYEGLSVVENWREESRVLLLSVIQAASTSAEHSAERGVVRKKINRRPTLLSLSELRDAMEDL